MCFLSNSNYIIIWNILCIIVMVNQGLCKQFVAYFNILMLSFPSPKDVLQESNLFALPFFAYIYATINSKDI